MTETLAGNENLLAFFDKVVKMTYEQIQDVLEGQEWQIFKHWLSLYNVEHATYELERARVRVIMQRRAPATIEEAEAKLPIDDALELWNSLIESVGGTKSANELIMGAAFLGHFVR